MVKIMTSACLLFWNSECKCITKKAATEIVTAYSETFGRIFGRTPASGWFFRGNIRKLLGVSCLTEILSCQRKFWHSKGVHQNGLLFIFHIAQHDISQRLQRHDTPTGIRLTACKVNGLTDIFLDYIFGKLFGAEKRRINRLHLFCLWRILFLRFNDCLTVVNRNGTTAIYRTAILVNEERHENQ